MHRPQPRGEDPRVIRTALVCIAYFVGVTAATVQLPLWVLYGPVLLVTAVVITFVPPRK